MGVVGVEGANVCARAAVGDGEAERAKNALERRATEKRDGSGR